MNNIYITKELLEDLYINKKYSICKISKILSYSRDSVYRFLNKFNIIPKRRGKLSWLMNENGKSFNYTRIKVNCLNCNKEKIIQKHKENRRAFCSNGCRNEWYSINLVGKNGFNYQGGNGSIKEYGYNWYISRKALRKNQKTCLLCNCDKNYNNKRLDIHHYIPFKFFGVENCEKANNCINLGSYCRSCHAIVEKISRLIWTKDFFEKTNILDTFPLISDKQVIKYSVYK